MTSLASSESEVLNPQTWEGHRGEIVLGYAPMDAVHAEFDELLARALACAEADLESCLERAVTHLHTHFAAENQWMEDTTYPAAECHLQEHASVLRSAAEVQALVARGDAAVGRSFLAELARWFPGHAHYLDSALAAWMSQKRLGGKPLVLHRKIAQR